MATVILRHEAFKDGKTLYAVDHQYRLGERQSIEA
jgi:hypothetical protein